MHVKVITPSDETLKERDYRVYLEIEIEGKESLSFYDGEPEDNSLSRNFNDVYKITDLLRRAHDAGKNGEPFTIQYILE